MIMNKVSIQPVTIAPIHAEKMLIDGHSGGIDWTTNLNGINTYGTFIDWNPMGNWEIKVDLFIDANVTDTIILSGNAKIRLREGRVQIISNNSENYDTLMADSSLWLGKFCHIHIIADKDNKKFHLLINNKEISTTVLRGNHTFSQFSTVNLKGQITNCYFIDKTNEQLSRFYQNIIHSDNMPETPILKDIWGDGSTDCTLYNLGIEQPYVPLLKSGDRIKLPPEEEPFLFTVYQISNAIELKKSFDLLNLPDVKPRLSNDNKQEIATGLFKHPDIWTKNHTESSAISLMNTPEWIVTKA